MKEEKTIIFNPCRKCIVRAACTEKCPDFNDFFNNIETVPIIILSILSAIILIVTYIFFSKLLVFGWICFSYGFMIHTIITEGVDDMSKKDIVLMIIFISVVLPATYIFDKIDKIYNFDEKAYRYNKRLKL
jgi:hypothetical protein